MTLWAGAIGAGGGDVPIGRIVASYPTMPFFATTLLEFITPAGTPTPALLAAALLGAARRRLVPARFARRRTCRSLAAAAATLLIALASGDARRAASPAPAEMFLVAFLYLLGKRALRSARAHAPRPR